MTMDSARVRVPMVASFKHSHGAEAGEPIKCAQVLKPSAGERHKTELVRYLVLAVAFIAILLLIAIALYYTQGNVVHIQHIGSVPFHPSLPV